MAQTSAIDTAVRFGEIPFTDFTKELITGTFDAIVGANLKQMDAYVDMVQTLAKDLSTYINETKSEVSLSEIKDLVSALPLPNAGETNTLVSAITQGYNEALGTLTPPASNATLTANNVPVAPTSGGETSWAGVVNSLIPAIKDVILTLVPNNTTQLDLNSQLAQADLDKLNTSTSFFKDSLKVGTRWYTVLYEAMASKIANDKYTLLQNMAKMGLLRLVVDSGKIETRITFSTYESHLDESQSTHSDKTKETNKLVNSKRSFVSGLFAKGYKDKQKTKEITINTAKDIHRDVSGSSVQIFGSVVINFKTDYLPLSTAQ